MKKLLIGLGVIVVLAGAGLTWVVLNVDTLTQRVIETAGSGTLGSPVTVDSVDIDLFNGNATLGGFRVANPEGFSRRDMMRFDALRVDIALGSLTGDTIRINSVRTSNPYMLYELQGSRSNLDAMREQLPSGQPAEPQSSAPGGGMQLSIGEVRVEGIQGRLQSDRLPRSVDVELGDIVLRDMEGTPSVIARQIARPLLTQVSRTAASALVEATSGMLEGELSAQAESEARALRDQAEQRLRDSGEEAERAVQDTADNVEDRIRGLFSR